MFKIKDGYKLEWQTPETMKIFDFNDAYILVSGNITIIGHPTT